MTNGTARKIFQILNMVRLILSIREIAKPNIRHVKVKLTMPGKEECEGVERENDDLAKDDSAARNRRMKNVGEWS